MLTYRVVDNRDERVALMHDATRPYVVQCVESGRIMGRYRGRASAIRKVRQLTEDERQPLLPRVRNNDPYDAA